MGNLIFNILFVFLTLFGGQAFAQDVNLLKNPNFESRTAQWTKTGSSTFTIETVAPLEGIYSANWDASATSEFFRSSTYAISEGLKGRRCVIEMEYLWDSGVSGEILMNVDDGTNNIAQLSLDPTVSGVTRKASLSFECPTSGSLRFELESTANTAAIRVDKMFLGSGKNTVQLSQANFVGSAYIETTGSCTWSRTNTALGAFTTTAACPGPTVELNPGPGSIQTTDTDLPRFTVNSLPAGTYRVLIQGGPIGNGATNSVCLAVSDGTDTRGRSCASNVAGQASAPSTVEAIFTYTSSGNRTFEVFGSSSSSTILLNNSASNSRTVFSIFKYPTNAAEAITVDTTGASWSGYHDSTCSWARTNTAYGDPTADASCALVERQNSGFGAVTTSGSVLPAITFTPKIAGKYWACAYVKPNGGTTGASQGFRLWDGTTVIAEGEWNQASNSTTGTVINSVPLCGLYNIASISATTLSVQTKASAGAATLAAVTATSAIEWSIFPITQQLPAPVFTEIQNLNGAFSSEVPLTFTAGTSGTFTKGTTTADAISYSRQGKFALVRFKYRQTVAGTNGVGNILITMPGGLVADTTFAGVYTGTDSTTAKGFILDSQVGGNTGASNGIIGRVYMYDSTHFCLTYLIGAGAYGIWGSASVGLANTTTNFIGYARIPIVGWD